MNFEMLAAFTVGMIVLSATPGPGVLASVARALAEGLAAAFMFIAGLVLGDMMFFMLALLGMSAISQMMGALFYIIKIAGGIYLIFLGIQTIRKRRDEAIIANEENPKSKSFLSGLMVTLGNPKPILFYAGIVPTIIDLRYVKTFEVLTILFIIAAVSFIVIGAYCILAAASKFLISNDSFQRKMGAIGGLVMIAAGSYIILKKS